MEENKLLWGCILVVTILLSGAKSGSKGKRLASVVNKVAQIQMLQLQISTNKLKNNNRI